MNMIAVNAEEIPLLPDSESLISYVRKVLAEIGIDNWELSVFLCGDETIKSLNSRYRSKPEPTDVLSFELGAQETMPDGSVRCYPGDIVISLDTLRENARYFQISEDEELRRLLIHGILHLNGMDHAANGTDEPMIHLQESILEKLKEEYILSNTDLLPVRPLNMALSGHAGG